MKKVVQRERLKRREKSRVKIQAMTMNEIGKKYVYSNVYLNKYWSISFVHSKNTNTIEKGLRSLINKNSFFALIMSSNSDTTIPKYLKDILYDVVWDKTFNFPCLIVSTKNVSQEALKVFNESNLVRKIPVVYFCAEDEENR